MSAVSARPLRAPWVEMKYSSTVRPSRKLERIGFSMMSPDGLGHQAAHAGELAHLLAVAARAGIHHEPDRIELLLALVLLERLEHDVGDLVGAVGPDVDDLVVAFAGGDDALAILLLDFA